jgi:hypothetical protein
MRKLFSFISKWLIAPLLPIITLYSTSLMEKQPVARRLAGLLQTNPSPDYVKDVNAQLTTALLSFLILLVEGIAGLLSRWKGVVIDAGFYPPREFRYVSDHHIGRREDALTLLTLVIETQCPKPAAEAALRRLVPDLSVRARWPKKWLIVETDEPALKPRVSGETEELLVPMSLFLSPGNGDYRLALYLGNDDEKRGRGTITLELASSHQVRLFLARRILLTDTLRPVELHLLMPAVRSTPVVLGGTT